MGESVLAIVDVSYKTQKIVAITLGVVLIGVIGAIWMHDTLPENFDGTDSSTVKDERAIQDEVVNAPKPEVKLEKVSEDTDEATESAEAEMIDLDTAVEDYTYTAGPGDSYTALARLAVREYSITNNLNLTYDQVTEPAAVIAVNAGSPLLKIGQVVTIVQSDISAVLGTSVECTPPAEGSKTE